MHNKSYNPIIACLCSKNFINSIDEIKSFISFEVISIEKDIELSKANKFNALMIESGFQTDISLEKFTLPKIFINSKNQNKSKKNSFELFFKLPLKIVKFNQAVVDLCKKYEFGKNSVIRINSYILDKNERVLKKDNKSLKITEKEIYFIEKLNSSKNPLSKEYILKNIWSYASDTDTHTVETHIYRLRQKIKEIFGDKNFIKNSPNGYSI